MSRKVQTRHDISDEMWGKIEPYLPGRKGSVGNPAKNNREFINGVLWILRTGAPWRDLPSEYGNWNNVHRRFCRWRDRGIWEGLLSRFIENPDMEWLMIDASHIKVHLHATGAVGGNQDMGNTKGGSIPRFIWPWMRLAIRSESLLLQVPHLITRKLTH